MTTFVPDPVGEIEPDTVRLNSKDSGIDGGENRSIDIEEELKGISISDATRAGDDISQSIRGMIKGFSPAMEAG
jgi:hypothetical protein